MLPAWREEDLSATLEEDSHWLQLPPEMMFQVIRRSSYLLCLASALIYVLQSPVVAANHSATFESMAGLRAPTSSRRCVQSQSLLAGSLVQ